MELLVATTNRGKFVEVEHALRGLPIRLNFLGDFSNTPRIGENQPTFEGNALKKAREIAKWSGKAALADDSGLVVQALGGRPGIHSARFAGAGATDEENRQKLLDEMKSVPEASREASFICALAVVGPLGKELTVEGRCEGVIIFEPRGTMGFGYDPLFYIPSLKRTMAELSLEEKNKISHRSQALQRLKNEWTFIHFLG